MTTSTAPSEPVATASSASRRRLLLSLGLTAALLCGGGFYLRAHPQILVRTGLISLKASPLRQAYERQVRALCDDLPALRARGLSTEEIARHLHRERRALGSRYKEMTPEPLRQRIATINQERYGDPLGPSFDYLTRKHKRDGSIDYDAIIVGACRANPDVDRLLRR